MASKDITEDLIDMEAADMSDDIIQDYIDNSFEGKDIPAGVYFNRYGESGGDDTPDAKPKPKQIEKEEQPDIPVEKYIPLDSTFKASDFLTIVNAEIERKKIGGHHIDSMNWYYKKGIKQVMTKIFRPDYRMKSTRDKTEEDREISDIYFSIEFTDVNLVPPTTNKHRSGSQQFMTPNIARINHLTYSSDLYVDAKITAIATKKNGTQITRYGEVKDHRIAKVPIMVGTEFCTTWGLSREALRELEEDPNDPGGYFIVKGVSWAVDSLENLTNNVFHVYKNWHLNEIVRGTFLSKPGDAFENSYQLILRYLNNGAISIEITTNKFNKFEIPFYILFRALGVTNDRDIINQIVNGIENTDPITKHMLKVLEKAMLVEDSKFKEIKNSTDSVEIIAFLSRRMNEWAANVNVTKDENAVKYLNINMLTLIDKFILPHVGQTPDARVKKLIYIAHLINKMIKVEMGVNESTDRDSYKNKRIHPAGVSFTKAFKQQLNFIVIQPLRKYFAKAFRNNSFMDVQLADVFINAINPDDLERVLVQSITSGNKVMTVRKNEIMNRMSSQQMYYKNDLNVKAVLNNVNTPNTSASKQNERADVMRRVHSTYVYYIDISQSADSGEKVGMTKQMACMASICGASSSYNLKLALLADPMIIPLETVPPADITRRKLAKVFVNGDWIGFCEDAPELAFRYRMKRRYYKIMDTGINPFISIYWDVLSREINFATDVGRMTVPFLIVYNNLSEYIEKQRQYVVEVRKGGEAAKKAVKPQFKQWTKLTREHIDNLACGKITMEDLVAEAVYEFITPEEAENTFVAVNYFKLLEHQNDITMRFTHVGIDQAIYGIVALASPMANHSSAARITMYTNHRKQSTGWFALNWPHRLDKNTFLQYFAEQPLVRTFTDSLTNPNGINAMVCLTTWGSKVGPQYAYKCMLIAM